MAFCSTFSVLGASPAVTTPSMLSAMTVALVVSADGEEGAERRSGAMEVDSGGRGLVVLMLS